jgi:hypothetical protein
MPPAEKLIDINPDHIGLLEASLRSPSAHNAQPWKIKPLAGGSRYELHYDHNDYLPDDPDDRDAYLTMGAFVETMVLEGPNFGFDVSITPVLTRNGDDLLVTEVRITPLAKGAAIDPLSAWVGKRHTNRNHYQKDPLPKELETALEKLGNTLVEPALLEAVLTEASMKSWANPRFVKDLHVWYRSDLQAPDGFTSPQMHLSVVDTLALKFAFWRRSLQSKSLQRLYSTRDVAMFSAAPRAAVIGADDMSPESLFDAGRRLLRSWVRVVAAGYSYHPFSIAIDEKSTAPKVAELTGVPVPVALYRIGRTSKPPRMISNRKPLSAVILP